MKKFKKGIALLIAAMLTVGTLAGCGGSGGDSKTGETEAAAEKVLNFGCAMYTDGVVNSVMD